MQFLYFYFLAIIKDHIVSKAHHMVGYFNTSTEPAYDCIIIQGSIVDQGWCISCCHLEKLAYNCIPSVILLHTMNRIMSDLKLFLSKEGVY